MDIRTLTDNLHLNPDGIWISKKIEDVHWPTEGHTTTYNIENLSVWFQHRNACVLESIKNFPPSGPLFDIGGGNGYVSLHLRKHGYETVILEPTVNGTQHAKNRNLDPIIYATLEDAHFKPSCLSAIGLFDVIEHIEDDETFLKNVNRVLKKKGRVYVTVPASQALWSPKDEYVGHYRRYNLQELTDLLKKTGFSIDYATYTFMCLFLPAYLLRQIPKLFGFQTKYTLKQHKKEHLLSGGILGKPLRPFLNLELAMINKKHRLPFGYSCLVVASRN